MSFWSITILSIRYSSIVMSSLPTFVFFTLCHVVSTYYKYLSAHIIAEEHENEDQMNRFHQFLPIFTRLRDVTEFIRRRFGLLLMITVPFIYVNLTTNVYLMIVHLKVNQSQSFNYGWCSLVLIENLLRICTICFGIGSIHDEVYLIHHRYFLFIFTNPFQYQWHQSRECIVSLRQVRNRHANRMTTSQRKKVKSSFPVRILSKEFCQSLPRSVTLRWRCTKRNHYHLDKPMHTGNIRHTRIPRLWHIYTIEKLDFKSKSWGFHYLDWNHLKCNESETEHR